MCQQASYMKINIYGNKLLVFISIYLFKKKNFNYSWGYSYSFAYSTVFV
jgi:hypothetical protein